MFDLSSEASGVVARIRDSVPEIAAEAREAERLRRPTDEQIRLVRETGIFELLVPRAYGGLEQDLDAFLEAGLALAEADISIAWVSCFYVEHNWLFCQMPESFQRALFRDCSHVLAPAVFKPSGEVSAEAGGVRIRNGRWPWASGAMHGSHVLVGGMRDPEQGMASLSWFALPREDVEIEDTWYMDGMQGTGSNDIVVRDAFVPDDRIASVLGMAAGNGAGPRLHGAPIYRTPMLAVLSLAALMPLVGHARAVVRGFREHLLEHVRVMSTTALANKPAAQMRLARADLQVRQAELLVRDVVADVMRLRDAAKPEQRAGWASSFAHAAHQAKDAIALVAEGSGASAHALAHPLQRALRDANTASCHIVFDRDTYAELHGSQLLGLEPTTAMF